MTDEELPVLLLTCSGISHTGQLTTMTGNLLRCRNPLMVTRHLKLTSLERSLEKELDTDEYLVAVDGCEECCAKKRMDLLGKIPDTYVVATREGIEKGDWKSRDTMRSSAFARQLPGLSCENMMKRV